LAYRSKNVWDNRKHVCEKPQKGTVAKTRNNLHQ